MKHTNNTTTTIYNIIVIQTQIYAHVWNWSKKKEQTVETENFHNKINSLSLLFTCSVAWLMPLTREAVGGSQDL